MTAPRPVLIVILMLAVFAAPRAAGAQPAGKIPRIGYLTVASALDDAYFIAAMRERGYIEGQIVAIERRLAEGRPERLPALAAELVQLNRVARRGAGSRPRSKEATSPSAFVVGAP